MAERDAIVEFCSELLDTGSFQDVALNGLQIEGNEEIRSVTLAVSANQYSIQAALEHGCDALLVHHGLVLNGQVGDICGPVRHRLKALLANDINLIGYHLPLDGHPELGNNARLIQELGLTLSAPLDIFGPPAIGFIASSSRPLSMEEITQRVSRIAGHSPIMLEGGPEPIERIAVLSGSGYPALEEAARRSCQVLITGDAREPTMALARELGVSVLVAGHEATERLGVQALGSRISERFGVESSYVYDPNPL